MFFLNLGFQWRIPELENIGDQGVCIGAGDVNARAALTRSGREALPPPEKRLFDPQMYLRELDYSSSEPRVKRLATYPWLNPDVPTYEEVQGIREWENQIAEGLPDAWPCPIPRDPGLILTRLSDCLDFQAEFGVACLIVPVPTVKHPQTDFLSAARWIDLGLEVASDYDLPVYATLAIADICLDHRGADRADLLDIIVDQIGARQELDGVYIVLEQTGSADSSDYLISSNVAWALLRLCHDLGQKASLEVAVNYVDVFGLACIAAGAESFCAGPTTKAGRFCLSDYESRGFGAYPRFYSHSLVLDLLPERDIEQKIAAARLLRLIGQDETSHSQSLFEALRAGEDVADVFEWREERNNTEASRSHYVELVVRATEELARADDKITAIMTWLQDAERDAGYLAQRFSDEPLSADHRHIRAWRAAFENFLDQYNLS